jgi:hypothetical protein
MGCFVVDEPNQRQESLSEKEVKLPPVITEVRGLKQVVRV